MSQPDLPPVPYGAREPPVSLTLYHLLKWGLVHPMLLGYFRGRIYGSENVPRRGPLLVVSNHASYFDPPLLASAVRRPVAYMAKAELFEVPVLSPAIRLYGAYPVVRDRSDRAALRAALSRLKEGWAVGVFPQGTRTQDARIPAPKLGAALIAAKAQVPLLPVSLWGTQAILRGALPQPVPVTIRIGVPIDPPASGDRAELQAVTQHCVTAIHELHDLGR
ncbi:MAG: lysophospholipid acyltransferase family protein [Cyanobacteria bacterium P01_A01_bin.135]